METATSPGSVVAQNLAELRRARQLTVRDLAEELGRLGYPMLPSAITKIENRQRRVDVDDLVALAVALNVSPARLLLPAHDLGRAYTITLTPNTTVSRKAAWAWALGEEPLPEEEEKEPLPEQQKLSGSDAAFKNRWQEYTRATTPHSRLATSLNPVVRAVRLLARELDTYVADRMNFEFGEGPVSNPRPLRRALARVLREFADLFESAFEATDGRPSSTESAEAHSATVMILREDLAQTMKKLNMVLHEAEPTRHAPTKAALKPSADPFDPGSTDSAPRPPLDPEQWPQTWR